MGGHSYAVISPVVHGFALVGEPDKFTTASTKRFAFETAAAATTMVAVTGVPDEVVRFCAVCVTDLSLVCDDVSFDSCPHDECTVHVAYPPRGGEVHTQA